MGLQSPEGLTVAGRCTFQGDLHDFDKDLEFLAGLGQAREEVLVAHHVNLFRLCKCPHDMTPGFSSGPKESKEETTVPLYISSEIT